MAQGTGGPKKLPSVEKIVDGYLKAIGGKKAVATQRDASYDWVVQFNNQPIGVARTVRKAPCRRPQSAGAEDRAVRNRPERDHDAAGLQGGNLPFEIPVALPHLGR